MKKLFCAFYKIVFTNRLFRMAPKSLRVNAFTYFYIKQVYNKKNFDYLQINYCRQKKTAPTGATSLLQFQQFTLAVDSIGASLLQNDIAAATVKLLFASLLGRSGLP